eukprot:2898744-Rhodomonas_salina.1
MNYEKPRACHGELGAGNLERWEQCSVDVGSVTHAAQLAHRRIHCARFSLHPHLRLEKQNPRPTTEPYTVKPTPSTRNQPSKPDLVPPGSV